MHRDLFAALTAGRTEPLRDWLSQQDVRTSTLRALPRWDAEAPRDGVPTSRRPPGRRVDAAQEVSVQLPQAARVAGGPALLLLYILLEVEEAWEVSYHYRPLWDTLRGAQDALRDQPLGIAEGDQAAAGAVLALMESLDAQILTENALMCGRLASCADAAERAVEKGREAVDLALRAAVGLPELSTWLVAVARRYCLLHEAVARAARAIVAFLDTGASLDDAISAVAEAEQAMVGHRWRSELRAHRASLLALSQHKDAEWLRIDHGSVVFIYPFAVRGLTPEQVVAAGGDAAGWQLAGAAPLDVHDALDLDDVWDGSDPLGRGYDGTFLELPDVTIRGIDGVELGTVTAQVRFSRLGNHYVRFQAELFESSPMDVHAMLMRAAPEHGVVRVGFRAAEPDGQVWPRLSDFAMQLVDDVSVALQDSARGNSVRSVARPGMFQVVVSVNEASKVLGPAGNSGRSEVLTVEEFNSAVGAQVLTSPVASDIGSLAEWIRYPAHDSAGVDAMGLTTDWTVRTCNTVLLVAPGTPEWVTRTRGSIAEFVASLDGLFAGWSHELASHYTRAKEFQRRVAEAGAMDDLPADALGDLSAQLDEERLRLNNFAVEARSTMALIRSPSLVSSPVCAAMLGLLLDRSGYHARVEEIVLKIEEVAHEQLGLAIEKLSQQRADRESREEVRTERQQRAKLDTMLAVIAAVGVSGLGQILQAGYDIQAAGAVAIIMVIVILAVLVGGWFWRAAGRRDS